MYGVIYFWRVLPERRAEHDLLMRQTLRAERARAPEVLLNVTMGPAADGTCAEVQVYTDAASSHDFGERIKREDEELRALWDRYHEVCQPDGWTTVRFDGMDFLNDSFVREAAGIGWSGTGEPGAAARQRLDVPLTEPRR